MIESTDSLLEMMKDQIDRLLCGDKRLQNFLAWIYQKSRSIPLQTHHKPAAIRSLYFELSSALELALELAIRRKLSSALDSVHGPPQAKFNCILNHDIDRAIDLDLELTTNIGCTINIDYIIDTDINCIRIIALTTALAIDPDCDIGILLASQASEYLNHVIASISIEQLDWQKTLKNLKDQMPTPGNSDQFWQWWKSSGTDWIEELRAATIVYCNIGHDWKFTEAQKQQLRQYYKANMLLISCLNSDCRLSCEVREKIEATLLLPVTTP